MNRIFVPTHAEELRRCLVDCDIPAIRHLWNHISPQIPVPEDDGDVLIQIHLARTATERIPFRFRAYSHSWLTERKIRSLLPDNLRPRAERMYPRIVSAVGICVASLSNRKTDYHHAVSTAMGDVVENFYADGIEDPVRIKAAMKEVHDKLRKQR